MKIKKIILFSLAFGTFLILLIPAVNLLIKYFNEKENYSLEVLNDEQILLKYEFNETGIGSPLEIIRQLISSTNRKELTREKINLEDSNIYFEEIDKQHQIIGGDAVESSNQNSFQLGDFDSSEAKQDLNQILIKKQDITVLSKFKGSKVIHDFDDSGIKNDKNPYLRLPEKTDYQAASLEEFLNKNYQVLKKKNYQRPIQAYEVFPSHNFYTSPKPDKNNINTWEQLNRLQIALDKEGYYRFELIKINLIAEDHINIDDLKVYMKRGDYLIPNVGGYHDVFFRYLDGIIYTSYAMGYNPPSGDYEIVIKSTSHPEWKGISQPFKILRRTHIALDKGFSVVNWEYGVNIKKFKFTGPDHSQGGVEKLAEWLDYMGVDAFWMLAGQTTGWDQKVSPEIPWGSDIPFKNMKLMAPAMKKHNIKNGAYLMSFFTPANGKIAAGYINSLGYANGSLHDSLHISLMDKRRIQHIITRMEHFEKDPNIDFVGLDFIRTGRADGYEMGPVVIKDMNIRTPKNYEKFNIEDKVKWFARNVENQKNQTMIKKWRWWRAHKVASIVNQVIIESKLTKPLWVFTLGWEHGAQHGQDPYMFFDAGAFIDAVMLYEANRIQFRNMMVQWPNYMTFNQNNLMMGNASDLKFLDGELNNYGLEYLRRTKTAYKALYRKGLAKGIFIHDLSRALWSKRRYYDISEWALLHGQATSEFKKDHKLIPFEGSIHFDKKQKNNNEYTGKITIKNQSDQFLRGLQIQYAPTVAYRKVSDNIPERIDLAPGENRNFIFKAILKEKYVGSERPFGYYIAHAYYPKYFFITFNFNRSKKFLKNIDEIL